MYSLGFTNFSENNLRFLIILMGVLSQFTASFESVAIFLGRVGNKFW